jgi:glycerophosphoryl diester phosphodiesterase
MIIIAHRGNIDGPNSNLENSPEYIDFAIEAGFDVEIDLRMKDGSLYTGHDKPIYKLPSGWIDKRKEKLWIHCKDRESLDFCSNSLDLHYFYHENDRYTLTSKAIGWVLVGQIAYSNSIIVLPERFEYYSKYDRIMETKGICTDNCNYYRRILLNEME